MSTAPWQPASERPWPSPIDYLTDDLEHLTDDEAAEALLGVLSNVATAVHVADQLEHVTRCLGCGGWAWDDQPCPTCTALVRQRRAELRAINGGRSVTHDRQPEPRHPDVLSEKCPQGG